VTLTSLKRTSLRPFVLATLAVALVSACAKKPVPEPSPGSQALVVLLPDPDNASARATVSNSSGAVDLKNPREATRVAATRPPSTPAPMDEAEIQRLFGATLTHLPPPPQHFNLYFRFESDELTDESRAIVPTILSVVRERPVPEVTVIGHTDTMGDAKGNYDLGLKRAMTVRTLLLSAGLDPSLVDVASHGEADLLIPTPDETVEPRNRRVEITIR
jgi:peptidoglycan-associated lipoprotein